MLIFAQKISEVEIYTKGLLDLGIEAHSYHSEKQDRSRIEDRFKNGSIKVLVATVALAMGFDKHDIHAVIHTYTPASPVQYYQEIGRAGHGLDSARAYLLGTTPWRNDTARDKALQRIFACFARDHSQRILRSDIVKRVADNNVKKTDADAALVLGIGKGYFEEELHSNEVVFLRAPTPEEKADNKKYIQERAVTYFPSCPICKLIEFPFQRKK